MANKDWKSYPAGSRERYEAAKKDPEYTVGPFMKGDYRISPAGKKTSSRILGENEEGKLARRYFGKQKASGSDKRLFDMDPEANRIKAKYTALKNMKKK